MIYVIIAMVVVTVLAAATRFAPRIAEMSVVFDTRPDTPCAFGYRMAWLAIRSRDTRAVAERLGLINVQSANWQSGLGTVYDDKLGEQHIFVSPPVNGWTLVAGLSLPHPMGPRFIDKASALLLDLGQDMIEVQYFFSYPLIDFYAWARMLDGRIVRAFAIGDEGVVWNKGRATREEKAMGLKLFDLRGIKGRKGDAGGEIVLYPTEQHLMQLAAKWSLDPTMLGKAPVKGASGQEAVEPSLGIIGLAPSAWRPERLQRAA